MTGIRIAMNVETVVVGPFEVNCHILWDDSLSALVVDPGADASRIAKVLKRHGLSVSRYLLTHGHCDHVSAVAQVAKLFPAPVSIHPSDAKWAFGPLNSLPPYYGVPGRPDNIEVLDLSARQPGQRFTVIHTPGHSPGSVCYHLPEDGILLSGDTLFMGSVGRSDLQGGNSRDLAHSLKTLATLPDNTRVLTGHGDETTIGHEKASNFFLRGAG